MAITAALSPLDINLPAPPPSSTRDPKPHNNRQRTTAPQPRRQSDYHVIQKLRAPLPTPVTAPADDNEDDGSFSTSLSPGPSARAPVSKPLAAVAVATAAAIAPTKPKLPSQTPKKKVIHRATKKILCATPPVALRNKKRGVEYDRGRQLGEGGFARCFLVQNKEGKFFAAKTVAKESIVQERMRKKFFGEIQVQKMMRHPNIVRFVECFEDLQNIYLILELCPNKSLVDMLRRRGHLTEPETRFFTLQLLGALKYMHHQKRVIHRDLKLGNIFLDSDMNVKIGDFGLAAIVLDENDRKTTMCGTPNYIAPEVLFGGKKGGAGKGGIFSAKGGDGHSFEVDLWSMGVIIYALLIGKPPFQAENIESIYKKIRDSEFKFPATPHTSAPARALITSLLHPDPRQRPGLDTVADHPFFRHGWFPRSIPISATKEEPIFKTTAGVVISGAGVGSEALRRESRRNYLEVARGAGIGVDEYGQPFPCIGDRDDGEDGSVASLFASKQQAPEEEIPAPPTRRRPRGAEVAVAANASGERARRAEVAALKAEKEAAAARTVAAVIEEQARQQQLAKKKGSSQAQEYLLPESLSPRDGRARMRGTALLRSAVTGAAAAAAVASGSGGLPKRPSALGPGRARVIEQEIIVIEDDEEEEVEEKQQVRKGKEEIVMQAPRRPRRVVGQAIKPGIAETKIVKPTLADVYTRASRRTARTAATATAPLMAETRLAVREREKELTRQKQREEREREVRQREEREKEEQEREERARREEEARIREEREKLEQEKAERLKRERERQRDRAQLRLQREQERERQLAEAAAPPPQASIKHSSSSTSLSSRRAPSRSASTLSLQRPGTAGTNASHISVTSTNSSTTSSSGPETIPTKPDLSNAVGTVIPNTNTSFILDSLYSHITLLTVALTSPSSSIGTTTRSSRSLSSIPEGNTPAVKDEVQRWRAGESNRHIFITRWVDYTNKYGIGYTLTDGTLGVMYNDNTGLICPHGLAPAEPSWSETDERDEEASWFVNQAHGITSASGIAPARNTAGGKPGGVETVYKKHSTKMSMLVKERNISIGNRRYGKGVLPDMELAKIGGKLGEVKVGLWKRFGAYMRDSLEGGCEYDFQYTPPPSTTTTTAAAAGTGRRSLRKDGFGNPSPFGDYSSSQNRELVFVTTYARLKQGAFFRFSNGGVQFNFADHSKILLLPLSPHTTSSTIITPSSTTPSHQHQQYPIRFLTSRSNKRMYVLGVDEIRQVIASSSGNVPGSIAGLLTDDEVKDLKYADLKGKVAFVRGFLRAWWREGKIPGVRRRVGTGLGSAGEGGEEGQLEEKERERAAEEEVVVLGEEL